MDVWTSRLFIILLFTATAKPEIPSKGKFNANTKAKKETYFTSYKKFDANAKKTDSLISDARSGESPLNLGEFLRHRGILGENFMEFFLGEFAKNFRGFEITI